MQRTARSLAVVALAVVLAGALTAASCRPRPKPAVTKPTVAQVIVGSPAGTEGELLGAIAVRLLEARGFAVTDRTGSGSRAEVRGAFDVGALDVAVGLTPAGPVVCTSKDVSDLYDLRTLDDLARYVSGGGDVLLACPDSFAEDASGLRALESAYGFALRRDQLDVRSDAASDPALAEVAAGTVGFAVAPGTDPRIDDLGLVVLADPRAFAPTMTAAAEVREDVEKAHPETAAALAPAFSGLTADELRSLERRVAFGGEDVAAVAAEYLSAGGFLK